jgi:SAM-dependent methyltransferase
MNSAATGEAGQDYVLGRSTEEYERLRAQARVWEGATTRVLDRIALREGARSLDAGCGPGEAMRLLAERVGPGGHVRGIDVDVSLGQQAVATLYAAGHKHCLFTAADLEDADHPVPGSPYDVVYARLLLFHVADPAAVLRRLWTAVAPGGYLVVHDYDLRTVDVVPRLSTMEEWKRVVLSTFAAAGRDVGIGPRLPHLFAEAGVGPPDGTDVAGRLETLRAGGAMVAAVHRSLTPAAVTFGLTTVEDGTRWLADFDRDLSERGDDALLWPLLIGVWKQTGEASSDACAAATPPLQD